MYCPKCGKEVHDSAFMCEYCGQTLKQDAQPVSVDSMDPMAPTPVPPVIPQKPENVVTGTVGALLGALLGAAAIVLLNMAGYVASISGLILAICTFKGYELLGGRLTKKGIVISLILILVTPFLADQLSWAVAIYQAYHDSYYITFAEAFSLIGPFIEEGVIDKSSYISDLVMLYLFTALGAFSSVWNTIKGNKKKK